MGRGGGGDKKGGKREEEKQRRTGQMDRDEGWGHPNRIRELEASRRAGGARERRMGTETQGTRDEKIRNRMRET